MRSEYVDVAPRGSKKQHGGTWQRHPSGTPSRCHRAVRPPRPRHGPSPRPVVTASASPLYSRRRRATRTYSVLAASVASEHTGATRRRTDVNPVTQQLESHQKHTSACLPTIIYADVVFRSIAALQKKYPHIDGYFVASFPYFKSEPVPYTFVSVNRRNNEALSLIHI